MNSLGSFREAIDAELEEAKKGDLNPEQIAAVTDLYNKSSQSFIKVLGMMYGCGVLLDGLNNIDDLLSKCVDDRWIK